MNKNASPGPDGFGPGFYRKFWHTLKGKIHNFFKEFHAQRSDISCLKRALIILLLKNTDARSPNNIHPISLQNCPIKGVAKLLTNRLKAHIPLLVHADQTGFLSGRNISENFLCAADILHCCAKKKAPSLIVKLDFRKAFNSVCWSSLLHTLRVRGFPPVGVIGFNLCSPLDPLLLCSMAFQGGGFSARMDFGKATLYLCICSLLLQISWNN